MTWREKAQEIIANVTRDLPAETTLGERIKAVDAARPHWGGCSWPRKAWQAARREYLVPFGYVPRTKAEKERQTYSPPLPLFE